MAHEAASANAKRLGLDPSACLVVEDDNRLVGRVTLDDIGKAVLDGALLHPTLGRHLATLGRRLHNDASVDANVLRPLLDAAGGLVGVAIDRSTQRIQVARPDMSRKEFRTVLDAFLSSWISSRGPYVEKFEQEFRAFVGAQHGIAVSNGTVALHLALLALNVGPGDEVIVPDLTFAATINAVLDRSAQSALTVKQIGDMRHYRQRATSGLVISEATHI